MNSQEIRKTFLDYFRAKGHDIVSSAPIVLKNDPSLMFTNAGMNQFKDYFLGAQDPVATRVSDTQKCLRVSGKHNDLEEVGRDSYHHTMFEMLGNWSFGDYFKKEAIEYAWDLLTNVFKLNKEDLYITVFKGDSQDGTAADEEAVEIWKSYVPPSRILYFDKKDNFWEMGDTGPCGPCSEIHIDIRPPEEKKRVAGQDLVNKDHPQLIEIWNLVFIQYNRRADGSLEDLPQKHVDTGMGFERLCMVVQGQRSNYDSDLFTPYIKAIEARTGIRYTSDYSGDKHSDIAMRVITDHIRAICFTIADGEMPGNTGAGYVIRRILRRAVRYYYSFLNVREPFLFQFVDMLAKQFEDVFPELLAQREFVTKVVLEEEKSFLRTLEEGLKRLDALKIDDGTLSGRDAFELYDTYGFPFDLTRLVASEKGWNVDEKGFDAALQEQKERSRADASKQAGDWIVVREGRETEFIGYDLLAADDIQVLRYRVVQEKGKSFIQLVLNRTPFYAEGGGQVGDTGQLHFGSETVQVQDTKKENNTIIHYVDKLPANIKLPANAFVDVEKRRYTECNHSATHLLHAALRTVLGTHVQQKGSLVRDEMLRFDFSHYEAMTDNEVAEVEKLVNKKIRENIALEEARSIPIEQAKAAGAMMLFGEKYDDNVRMITFDSDFSVELCGGCHVPQTGKIGYFKIVSESGVAAGVRRITAITSREAEAYINDQLQKLNDIAALFKNPQDLIAAVSDLQEENKKLKKQIEGFQAARAGDLKSELIKNKKEVNGLSVIAESVKLSDAKALKTMVFNMAKELDRSIVFIANNNDGKVQLMLKINDQLVDEKGLDAASAIKDLARHVRGGGGGQKYFATAGGAHPEGIPDAMQALEDWVAVL